PAGIVQFIASTDRVEVGAMLRAHDYIDLMIPRGGADLIRRVRDEATMPVVAGGHGGGPPDAGPAGGPGKGRGDAGEREEAAGARLHRPDDPARRGRPDPACA